jgi:hypothetical protein
MKVNAMDWQLALLNFLIAKNGKKLQCLNRILTQPAGFDTFPLVVVQFIMTLFTCGGNVDFSGGTDKRAVLNFHGPLEMATVLALH